MNWERAKTILIVLFLLINVFLVFVLIHTTKNVNMIPAETVSDTADVLRSHGIAIDENSIPTGRHPNKNLNVVNILSEPTQCAQKFLGEGFSTTQNDADGFQLEYVNHRKRVTVGEHSFVYEFSKEPAPFDVFALDAARSTALDRLEKLGIGTANSYVIGEGFRDKLYELTIGATYGDTKIIGVGIRILADKEDIIKIEGNWFVPDEPEVISGEKLPDVTSVLIQLLYTDELNITEIKQVEFAYYLAEDYVRNKEVSTIPVYVVTGTDRKWYVFDARSGEFIKVYS